MDHVGGRQALVTRETKVRWSKKAFSNLILELVIDIFKALAFLVHFEDLSPVLQRGLLEDGDLSLGPLERFLVLQLFELQVAQRALEVDLDLVQEIDLKKKTIFFKNSKKNFF